MSKKVLKNVGLIIVGATVGVIGSLLIDRRRTFQTFVDVKEDMSDIIKQVTIFTKAGTDTVDIGGIIHEQLRGNPDYVKCNIVLSDDPVMNGGLQIGTYVTYTVYKESDTNPLIKLEA